MHTKVAIRTRARVISYFQFPISGFPIPGFSDTHMRVAIRTSAHVISAFPISGFPIPGFSDTCCGHMPRMLVMYSVVVTLLPLLAKHSLAA